MVERLAKDLLRVYRSRVLTPTIIEFKKLEQMRDLLPVITRYISVRQLKLFTSPGPFMSIFERLLSRVQNPLLSVKVLDRFKMAALPLPRLAIEDIAEWKEVEKVYLDKQQWALAAVEYPTVPDEAVYVSPLKKPFTTTRWIKELIGAEEANRMGYDGRGVTVGVIDTGGTPLHRQTPRMEYHTVMREKAQYKDKNGHGQWVASAIGGLRVFDRTLNLEVEGMAPACRLIGIKCLGFVIGTGMQSDVLEAMQLALELRTDIVNMSLGSAGCPETPEDDPEIKAVTALKNYGIIPVIAAGNEGPDPESLGTPGCAPDALTVGAYDPINGVIADFSSRGPPPWGEIKPDVVAPGVNIYSGTIGVLDAVGDALENRFSILSGTSMATPCAAGLLTCVRQYYRELGVDLTVDLVKEICAAYGLEKNNVRGWGAINWGWFKRYAEESLI